MAKGKEVGSFTGDVAGDIKRAAFRESEAERKRREEEETAQAANLLNNDGMQLSFNRMCGSHSGVYVRKL